MRVLVAPEPDVRIDQLRRGREIDIGDRELIKEPLLMLELLDGGRRVAKAQLKLPSGCGRPHHMQAHAELAAEGQRLVRARSTITLSAAARLQPREPRQSEHELGPLTALARQLDRLR